MSTYLVTERLARTADGRLVPYDHPDAAFLAYIPGQQISWNEAEAAGLVDQKAAEPVEDKMMGPVENKGVRIAPETRRRRR